MKYSGRMLECSGFQMMLRRGITVAKEAPKKYKHGVLCCDYTFRRILGTPNMSEVVLVDLLSALRFTQTGAKPAALQVTILDTKVRDGVKPKSKGELLVDVRASDDESNFIVEVQRRSEALFPHRALLYASADIVAQQRTSSTIYLKPTHTLAFCDYDFGAPKIAENRGAIGTSLNRWREITDPLHTPELSKAIQAFNLQSDKDILNRLSGELNVHLEAEMKARMSFVFALLPHAPLLQDVTSSTHPLLRWASLVAHLQPANIDTVPKDVRDIKGVQVLLEILDGSKEETELEQALAEQARDAHEREVLESKAEGLAEGEAKAWQKMISSLNIRTVGEFRDKFGREPPPEVLSILEA